MKLEEIEALWSEDEVVDQTAVVNEASQIGRLHSKYYKIYVREKLKLIKLTEDRKAFIKDKFDWYTGVIDEETRLARGWDTWHMRVLKTECERYLDADKDIIAWNLKIAYVKEVVVYLDAIIKLIIGRGYQINNIIAWKKFESGA